MRAEAASSATASTGPLGGPSTRGGGWRQWWIHRLPLTDTSELNHRNVYILPTRAGLMLAVTLLLLLVGSINYQLNLGYLLTFLLAGSTVVGMHVAHRNLRGLHLQLLPGAAAFAGQTSPVRMRLHNPSGRTRYAIALAWLGTPAADAVLADVPAHADAEIQLAYTPTRRGLHHLPAIHAETRFPMGAFRVWHWWRPANRCWVYPAPEVAPPPWPRDQQPPEDRPDQPRPTVSGDEPDDIRTYRRGDPLKWVLWKKAAKQAEHPAPQWLSRESSQQQGADIWLDHRRCGVSEVEAVRSRLCAWVLRADQLDLRYGLRLPGIELRPDRGHAHRQRCLEALACH